MKVTVPIHPFFNYELPVVRNEREQRSGRRYVVVEHPTNGLLRLPVEWTDRAASPLAQRINNKELQVDFKRLKRLHQMCATALTDGLDSDHSGATITKSQQQIRQQNGICGDNVAHSLEGAKNSGHRCVGNVGAQTASESST